jgi:hypothetical protein
VAVAPIALALVIGLAAGLVRRGRFSALARTRLRAVPLLLAALVCGLIVDGIDVPRPGIWAVVGLVAGLAFAARNLHLVGMAVVGVGLALNLLPVAVNGAMPVRADALVEAGMVDEADLDRVSLEGAREIAGPDTRLDSLGDIVPIAFTGQVLSFGDLIMLVGLADVVANLMLQRRSRRLPTGAVKSLASLGWNESTPADGGLIDLDEPVAAPTLAFAGQESAMTSASPVHDCGIAPPPAPVSGSQYSARPDLVAPATVASRIASPADDSAAVGDDRVVATQSR